MTYQLFRAIECALHDAFMRGFDIDEIFEDLMNKHVDTHLSAYSKRELLELMLDTITIEQAYELIAIA